jgi:hypothetical protein
MHVFLILRNLVNRVPGPGFFFLKKLYSIIGRPNMQIKIIPTKTKQIQTSKAFRYQKSTKKMNLDTNYEKK